MTLELVTIPCLADNYAYLLHDAASGHTTLIDAPQAAPILGELAARGWTLHDILLTHHHGDHIDAVPGLVAATGAKVTGAARDAHRLPPLDRAVAENDTLAVGPEAAQVIDVPGHTVGHVAYYLPDSGYAFTGDSLMAGGCGRLFEGTPLQMHTSLAKLSRLPAETLICSGHEYTAANLAFAAFLDPDNASLQARIARTRQTRAENRPTVPCRLSEELATNPFLRADTPALRAATRMQDAPASAVFAELRARKDRY